MKIEEKKMTHENLRKKTMHCGGHMEYETHARALYLGCTRHPRSGTENKDSWNKGEKKGEKIQ